MLRNALDYMNLLGVFVCLLLQITIYKYRRQARVTQNKLFIIIIPNIGLLIIIVPVKRNLHASILNMFNDTQLEEYKSTQILKDAKLYIKAKCDVRDVTASKVILLSNIYLFNVHSYTRKS